MKGEQHKKSVRGPGLEISSEGMWASAEVSKGARELQARGRDASCPLRPLYLGTHMAGLGVWRRLTGQEHLQELADATGSNRRDTS